ncbi:MAG: IS1634 family transposase [Candidatus Gastranaerophilales bacterium]|nr:IS1634 family transposase [Candidatus Gastranaerophilales bacterium]
MRLNLVKSKNTTQFYVIKSYRDENGKNTSKIIEKLGNEQEVIVKANGENPITWAKKYVDELNQKEKNNKIDIVAKFSQLKQIPENIQTTYNGGYLFLQDIYYSLKIDKICKEISEKYRIKYDLNNILSNLIYTRIIEPSSKLSSFEASRKFIEQPNFELQNIYRALEVISKETEFIEAEVYKNSLNVINRNTKILYYDCTNYFFEIEQAEGLKQYGFSKENRPNPITQMGLFMDGDGFPLAFNINSGNTNEQTTLKPLEKQIIKDFELSKFVVCTDAGLASNENRKFNAIQDRSYIVTQSLKKIKGHLKEWSLCSNGWHTINSNKEINLDSIEKSGDNEEIYYKERWINENGLEQRLIVSYSPKYAAYQKNVRNRQIEIAKNLISKPTTLGKNRQDDPKRFIKSTLITKEGEIADKKVYALNQTAIDKEEIYDGFYAVCTTLEDDISEIIRINKRRWEIEESFRILKTDFKARPVYLKRDDRIKAHFTTCFLSLLIYRILEHKLNEEYTSEKIITKLKEMNFAKIKGDGYIPIYTRNALTDKLHEVFNFRTDNEITSLSQMKKICKQTKKD